MLFLSIGFVNEVVTRAVTHVLALTYSCSVTNVLAITNSCSVTYVLALTYSCSVTYAVTLLQGDSDKHAILCVHETSIQLSLTDQSPGSQGRRTSRDMGDNIISTDIDGVSKQYINKF